MTGAGRLVAPMFMFVLSPGLLPAVILSVQPCEMLTKVTGTNSSVPSPRSCTLGSIQKVRRCVSRFPHRWVADRGPGCPVTRTRPSWRSRPWISLASRNTSAPPYSMRSELALGLLLSSLDLEWWPGARSGRDLRADWLPSLSRCPEGLRDVPVSVSVLCCVARAVGLCRRGRVASCCRLDRRRVYRPRVGVGGVSVRPR